MANAPTPIRAGWWSDTALPGDFVRQMQAYADALTVIPAARPDEPNIVRAWPNPLPDPQPGMIYTQTVAVNPATTNVTMADIEEAARLLERAGVPREFIVNAIHQGHNIPDPAARAAYDQAQNRRFHEAYCGPSAQQPQETNMTANRIVGMDETGKWVEFAFSVQESSSALNRMRNAVQGQSSIFQVSSNEFLVGFRGDDNSFALITFHRELEFPCSAMPVMQGNEKIFWTPADPQRNTIDRSFIWSPPRGIALISIVPISGGMPIGSHECQFGYNDLFLVAFSIGNPKIVLKSPLPNVFDDGRCCTGSLRIGEDVKTNNAFTYAREVRKAWLANTWNMDLAPNPTVRELWLTFDSETSKNILPANAFALTSEWKQIVWDSNCTAGKAYEALANYLMTDGSHGRPRV